MPCNQSEKVVNPVKYRRSQVSNRSGEFPDCYRKVKSVKSAQRQKIKTMQPEATYLCDHCGEEIVIPIDSSAGSHQEYIEDCPVCCNPMLIHVQLDDLGDAVVWSEAESEGNG